MTSNELNQYMVNFLNHAGHIAFRENTARSGKGNRKLPKGSLGIADVIACMKPIGLHVEFEGKIGKDLPRKVQVNRQNEIIKAGGFYFFISSAEQFHEIYNELLDVLSQYEKILDVPKNQH